jgi:hypothetical protein
MNRFIIARNKERDLDGSYFAKCVTKENIYDCIEKGMVIIYEDNGEQVPLDVLKERFDYEP